MTKALTFLLLLSFCNAISAQNTRSRGIESVGLGLQIYPAGTMINLKSNWKVSPREILTGKLGYNFAMRQDFGKHDNEEGGGPGFTVAYKRYFKTELSGWFMEARAAMWFLDIDWGDNTPLRSGNTDITVVQPTVGLGYDFLINHSLKLGFIAAFGYEVNVATNGEDVGEGGISLLGISLAHKLGSKQSASTKRK